jgi:hypothetical protein
MRNLYLIGVILFLLLGAAGLYAFQQPPSVTITPAQPSTIYVNSTTTVTITADITDSRVIATGVNLINVNPNTGAQSVAGTLVSQGSGVFSVVIQPDTSVPQIFSYEVSAAFRGLLKRSISLPIAVAVAPIGVILPPDPGPAGLATLAGVDTTGTGIRDDMTRWIAVTFYNSAKTRAAATQFAQALQTLITGATDTQTVLNNVAPEIQAQECLDYIDFSLKGGVVPQTQASYAKVLAAQLNTYARAQVYYADDQQLSGQFFGGPPGGNFSAQCNFNVSALPN